MSDAKTTPELANPIPADNAGKNANPNPVADSAPQNNAAKVVSGPAPAKVIKINVGGSVPKQTISSGMETLANTVPSVNPKTLEPVIDSLAGIFDSTCVQITSLVAEIVLEDGEKADSLAEKVSFTPESRAALKISGARLAAKHMPNTDTLDYVVIAAALSQMGTGMLVVAKELVAIRKLKQKELALKQQIRQ